MARIITLHDQYAGNLQVFVYALLKPVIRLFDEDLCMRVFEVYYRVGEQWKAESSVRHPGCEVLVVRLYLGFLCMIYIRAASCSECQRRN